MWGVAVVFPHLTRMVVYTEMTPERGISGCKVGEEAEKAAVIGGGVVLVLVLLAPALVLVVVIVV